MNKPIDKNIGDELVNEVASYFKNPTKHFRESICEKHGAYQEKGISIFRPEPKWMGCEVCKAEEKEREANEKELREKIEAQQKIEARMSKAGIPIRFREKDFSSYIADTKEKKLSLSVARDFADSFEENHKKGMTLIFSGKAGTGKSHLAISIAKSVMPKYTAMYLNALDAVRMIRDTWRKDSEKSELDVLELLGSIDLLVIDEVGVQYGTDNEQMLMFDIINRRYRDCKPMILITNLGVDGFKDYMTERSFDRLRENGKWVAFDWESYRPTAKQTGV